MSHDQYQLSLPRVVREGRYAVLDLETTGFGETAEIVQIAIVHVNEGRPAWRMWTNIQPSGVIAAQAAAKHGLTADLLVSAPRLDAELAAHIHHMIVGRTLLGYNIRRFDRPVLRRVLAVFGFDVTNKAIDVFDLAKRYDAFPAPRTLENVASRWNAKVGAAHNALDDCRSTWNLFVELASQLPHLGDKSPSELME